ncbi:MAG TPA: response regulator, partial [Planctomycetota bacterium]|nr:response regulator [Planctomycetota bacterium]
ELAEECPPVVLPDEAPAPSPARPPSADRRLLLVDDNSTLRAILSPMLHGAGYEVIEAQDGKAALATLGRTGCDAIVCDVQMPRMDGWQLLQCCAGRVPFVLMTGQPEPDGPARARQSGACAYLVKDEALGERIVAALRAALPRIQESLP